jgi:hypothetical protein
VTGGGLYHLSAEERVSGSDFAIQRDDRTTAFGVTYGGGLEGRLGSIVPFVEVRHHILLLSADNASFIPVVIGLRF